MAGRTPTVTIGQATGTGQKIPKVTVGRAYGQTDNGAAAFTFKELTGPDQRTVRLTERALPYKGVAFGISHRIDETDYPGFSQTSQQALGGKWDPTEIKGCWKTRFIGETSARMVEVGQAASEIVDGVEAISVDNSRLRTTEEVVALFEDIALKGQVLRVQWRHIVRVGRIEQFVPNWLTAHDCEWTIKFKWIGRDEDAGVPALGGVGTGSLEFSQRMSAAFTNLYDKTALDGVDLEPSLADRIDNRVGRIKRGILRAQEAARTRIESVTGTADALRRLMSISSLVRDEAATLIGELDGLSYAAMTAVEDPADLLTVPIGKMIQAACAIRQSVRAARSVKHLAARQRYDTLREMDAHVIAIVLLKQDEDCQALSMRFYGTPEEAARIRLFNALDSNTAPAGTIVIIPALDANR
jgi:hypothetical protein